ncbi:MAG TPA: AraC family transcriptional regulator ligand-binding domain-containing protein [Polyangiaceae bacterium]
MRSNAAPDGRAPRERTSAAGNALALLAYAEARGLARAAVAARFGLDLAALDEVEGRLPTATLTRMSNELPALAGDPDMPLHVLPHAARAEPPLTVLVFLASPTLGDALRRLVRFERVTLDTADEPASELVIDGDRAHIVLHHERSSVLPPTGAVIDALLGVLMLARMATKHPVMPLAITLRHPLPSRREEYDAALGCRVTFGAERDRMTLAASDLALRHPEASRTMLAIVERHAADALSRLPRGEDFTTALRRSIRARLPDGPVTSANLAAAHALSPRTLQRRLEAAGTSVRKLLDEERRALALHHIQNRRTPLIEIAFLLGFSDASAFTRAFTRWMGRSPSEYRQSLL